MAEAAVTFLLEQVKEAVIAYKDLISSADEQFEKLKTDLDYLKNFLKDHAEIKNKDNRLRGLEKNIRKVVYEVEDTIDTCFTEAIKLDAKAKKSRRPNFLKSSKASKSFSLATQVKTILEGKVQPLIDDTKKFPKNADGAGGGEHLIAVSKRDTPIRQNKVVGFDGEEKTIIGYLEEKREKLDVISIVGIPGQGKTTLAWKIYDNDDIGYEFPIRIWIYISQAFNSRDVFLQILKKFSPSQDNSNLEYDELVKIVRTCLEKEKFLLVLDDVWSVDAWSKIKEVLPENNGLGKVLITSRETDVGTKSSVYREPHKLRFLDADESWELLQYEVFNSVGVCPPELKAIGQGIAIKCDGVPLTIVVIGGILADQLMKSPSTVVDEWKMVKNVSEALQHDKAQRITDVVALSYNRMSEDLRDCFVYLGVFPEDYKIPAKMLCGLWISEGFILPKNGRSLEECAELNLNDLISRNLLKVEKRNDMGKVKTCRVHDMIRAFCISKSKEEDLFQDIKRSKTGEFEPPISEVPNLHRLCFRSDLSKFLSQNPNGPHVRSFLCFYDQPVELEPENISAIPDSFKKLRILESKCIKFDKFPLKLTTLIHLRYLTLCIETLKELPESIAELWNLQSLVVETKTRTITVRANVWNMIRLRYLKTKAAFVLDSKSTGDAGHKLHTLNRLAPESCTEVVSQKAINLRTLGISGRLTTIFETKFLEKLRNLEKLKLVNSLAYEQTSEDVLPCLPSYDRFPPYLRRLTLTNTALSWENMSTLAMIRNLEILKLRDNAFTGVSWNVVSETFQNLQLLLISNISELVSWEVPEPPADAFPKLKFLVVKNCESLNKIPEPLGKHLEKLEIDCVRKTAVDSAKRIWEKRIKEDKEKEEKEKRKFRAQFNLIIGPACGTK